MNWVLKFIDYDPENGSPETGYFRWLAPYGKKHSAGDWVKGLDHEGYRRLRIAGQYYLEHRLVWELVHGSTPPILDHINGNRLDNRIENLRPATRTQNAQNRKVAKNSTTGLKGVTPYRRAREYQAQIMLDGKKYHLGLFNCPIEAAQAYNLAVWLYQPEYGTYNEAPIYYF